VAVQGAGDEGETSTWRRVGLLALQDAQGRLYLQGPVGSDVEGFMPLPVEALAESLPFVRRAVLLELEGRSALLVLLTEGLVPADWEELLREATGVWRVQGASRLSLLDPFGPTPPRRALARALISRA
jgi:hypothetical protein